VSLRWRLLLTLGLSFCVLWVAAAAWLYSDLRQQMRHTLDQRLAASARMVAGLVAQMPPDTWDKAGAPVLSMPVSTGVACQISSPRGRVLMRTHGDFAGRLDTRHTGFTDRVIDGHRWRLFTYVENGLHITTADRLGERVMLQRNVLLVAVVPFVVALLGSLLVLWFGIRRGLRPLERLRDELSQRAPEALTPIEIDHAPAELAPAIATLNHLLVRTDQALAREQRFTSDAAHELRTPLTAIKTHVQLASRLQPDKARVALVDAGAGIARLQRTLEQLLLLARVEAGETTFDSGPAGVDMIVGAALADVPDAARVQWAGAAPGLALAVPEGLATAALRNLLENALRHSLADQPVELRCGGVREHAVFSVRDRGDWPAEDSTRELTRRFWRGTPGRGPSSGSGLGLTIVAAIAERFGGQLDFEARTGGGLIALLSLPLSKARPAV
jgi:signal transduction histidine kinase